MTLKNNPNNKYFLQLSLATLKELKKSYMRVVVIRHNGKQWLVDPEITKSLMFFDKQIAKIINEKI